MEAAYYLILSHKIHTDLCLYYEVELGSEEGYVRSLCSLSVLFLSFSHIGFVFRWEIL